MQRKCACMRRHEGMQARARGSGVTQGHKSATRGHSSLPSVAGFHGPLVSLHVCCSPPVMHAAMNVASSLAPQAG